MDDGFDFEGTCIVLRDTGNALLVSTPSQGDVWVPHAVLHDNSEVYDANRNSKGKLIVKSWFAEQKGWL